MNEKQRKMIRIISGGKIERNDKTIKRLGLSLKEGIRLDRNGVILGSATGRGIEAEFRLR